MNLTEKTALDCGVKIDKPYIDTFFIPIKNHKYIIFDTRSRSANGEYDYYSDVLELVKKELKENGFDVFQICHEKSYRLACDRCFIGLNKKQEAYLISKAELLITNENFTSYIASCFNIKSILLYSVFNPKNTAPAWNKQSQIILESNRSGNKPTHGALNEKPKTVNLIDPFEVSQKILDSLKINHKLSRFELVNIGSFYHTKIIEVVPDFISSPQFLANNNVNLRLDLINSLNYEVFSYWIQNRKINLITNKNININLLLPYKANTALITIVLNDSITESFLKSCKSLGVPIKILCNQPEKLNEYRLKFLDWTIDKDFDINLKLDKIKKLSNKSKFISSKILLSKGKQFSSKAHWLQNKELDKNGETVTLSKEFEEELEFFKIYNEREEPNSATAIA